MIQDMRKDPESSDFNPHATRCAARSKRTGRRCRNPAMHGKRVCRLQPAIARIESGRYRGMSVKTLEKLAHALKAKLIIRFEERASP